MNVPIWTNDTFFSSGGGRPISSRDDRIANEDSLRELGRDINAGSTKGPAHGRRRAKTRRRWVKWVAGSLAALLLLGAIGAGYEYYVARSAFSQASNHPNICGPNNIYCKAELPNAPFNVLAIGSDSRVGLTGSVAAQTGASQVSGQRSDVIKIFHVDPVKGTIAVVSIPRDTMVTLLANQSLYGTYNRINVNLGASGDPSLLVKTIEANFGIPINHVMIVSFAGLIDAVDALGGVSMSFPYPARDDYSGLRIHQTGCQLLTGVKALAVARSRHYQYYVNGVAQYDGTSDFGRIDRQNQFLRALVSAAKSHYNPATLNAFLRALPKGVSIDNKLSFNELIGLTIKFHNIDPATLAAYTLPTAGYTYNQASMLTVEQPSAQQVLVKVFGQVGTPGGLIQPTNPPPVNQSIYTPPPPVVATPTTVPPTTTTTTKGGTIPPTTTTTVPVHSEPWYGFNPVACKLK